LIGFLAGPWGAVILGAVMIVGMLSAKLLDNKDASNEAEAAAKKFADRQADIGNFIDSTTGKLKEQNSTLIQNAILLRQANIDKNKQEIKDTRKSIMSAVDRVAITGTTFTAERQAGAPVFDPQILAVVRAANGDIEKLDVGLQRLGKSRPYLKNAIAEISGLAASSVLAARDNKKLADEISQLEGKTTGAAKGAASLIEKHVALAAATTPLERARAQYNLVLDQGAQAEKAGGKALDVYREKLLAAAKVVNGAEASQKAANAAKTDANSAERLAERLGRGASAAEATIRATLALADAYLISSEAGLAAEARAKASGDAIKKQGEIEAFVARQLRLSVAQRAADGAVAIASMEAQTDAQRRVNDQVAAGTLSASDASAALRDEAQLRPLVSAAAIAHGRSLDLLTTEIERMTAAQAASNLEAARAQAQAATANANDDTERMKLELSLLGKTNAERAVALAQLEAEQKLKGMRDLTPEEARALTAAIVGRAVAQDALTTATNNYNASLEYQADLLDLIDQCARDAASGMADAFGSIGTAIGNLTTELTGYAVYQQKIADDRRAQLKLAGTDATRIAQIEALAAQKSAAAQINHYGNIASAAKGFFKTKSAGYKVMETAEKAFRAVELAMAIKSMIVDSTKTASSVANSGIRAAADGAAAFAKTLASLPFPFNIAAGAAVLAALAAVGIKIAGGGSKGASIPSAEELQDAQGTGSTLGDSKAKSESIARSLELLTKNSNRDLEYSNAMVKSLRAIETNIGQLSSLIARQLGISGGAFDTSALGLGGNTKIDSILGIGWKLLSSIPVIGGFLGAIGKALFGTKTTLTLLDQGLRFTAATIEDILASGIDGQTYQDIQKKKKKKFLGVTTSNKTSVNTVTGDLDSELESQVALLIGSLRDGIVSAGTVLGIDGAAAVLDAFKVDLGKISLKDLTGAEIQEQLNAVFSKLGDDMARAAIPGLDAFQKVGEGVFETLMRLAKDYMTIDTSLKSIGMIFGAVGAASVEARENLIDLFGSLDAFTEQTQYFRENFLTDAEQIAPIAAAVREEMARLGLAGINTKDQFKAAVLGIDLTSAAGQDLYASLLAVAPAFNKVAEYAEEANRTLSDAFKSTVSEFEGYAKSLIKYRDELRQGALASGNPYGAARSAFLSTAALAAQGNAAGLSGLEGAGKALLSASRDNASTFNAYLRDVAMVANAVDAGIFAATETADYAQLQLDALNASMGILASIDAGIVNVQTLLGGSSAPATVSTVTAATAAVSTGTDPVTAELRAMRAETAAVNTKIVDNTAAILSLQRRWDGDGLLVKTDPDTPLDVSLANTADAPVYVDQI
jgi:hypothetical protein